MPPHVIPALAERRRELMGELAKAQELVQRLHTDLASLDDVIRQFDPEFDFGTTRPKYRRAASPAEFGAMGRTVLDHLRRAGGPTTVKAIADGIIAERGLNATDRSTVRSMMKRVDMALRYQRTNGVVQEAGQQGNQVLWDVAR